MNKHQENQDLIHQNLQEEVTDLKKEVNDLNERKKALEDFVMKHM